MQKQEVLLLTQEAKTKMVQAIKKIMQKDGLSMLNFIDSEYWEFKMGKCSKSKIAKMKRDQKKYGIKGKTNG